MSLSGLSGVAMSLGGLSDAVAYARQYGAGPFLRHARYHVANGLHDRRLGIDTGGMVAKSSLEFDRPDSIDYVPIGYGALYSALRTVLREGIGRRLSRSRRRQGPGARRSCHVPL